MTRARDIRPVLITGGAGFIGCNVADRLASEGRQVLVLDSLARPGAERNLEWLESRHGGRVAVLLADTRDEVQVGRAVARSSAVFHFAAQVAVTDSLTDPVSDFEVNARGTLNLLEAVRRSGTAIPLIFASTNKIYGDLADIALEEDDGRYRPIGAVAGRGIDESRAPSFHTPYGCSKGAADQYVLDYGRSFGIPTVVFRMSCIYGQRQMGTEDQGWVAHFLIRALEGQPITIYGDGRQVRDILDVGDAVDAYVSALERIDDVRGRAFNLGGGPANAISLLQLVEEMKALFGQAVELRFADWRTGDQRWYVSNPSAARSALGLGEPLDWRSGVARLADWLARERGSAPTAAADLVRAAG